MRKTFISLALLTAVLLGATTAGADEERSGATGATELRIPVGARANAIGGAVVADVSGAEALFWNPAGIAHGEAEVAYSYTNYFADMDLNWLGFTTQMGNASIGASVKMLSVGDLIVTTEESPDGTGEIISPTFGVIGLSYGRALTDRVLVGTTVNIITEQVLQESATGVGFDFGFQYLLGAQGLQFGLAIKNVGPRLKFGGGDLEQTFIPGDGDPGSRPRTFTSSSAGFEQPSYVSLGASYQLIANEQSTLLLNGDFQSNSFSGDEFRGGAEWSYRAGAEGTTVLSFRGGFSGADQTGLFASSPGVGAGLSFPVGEASSARLEYSRNFLDSDFSDFFDDLDTLTLSLTF